MACAPAKDRVLAYPMGRCLAGVRVRRRCRGPALAELAEDAPLRFLGFPAFMYRAVKSCRKIAPGLRVDPRSIVIAGGGWKNHAGVPLSHEAFARFLEESLGLPRVNVRDVFGWRRHGVPYGACRYGHHHVPVFGRLSVRDPRTLEVSLPVPRGSCICLPPTNTAQPNCSLLATDVARLEVGLPLWSSPEPTSLRSGGEARPSTRDAPSRHRRSWIAWPVRASERRPSCPVFQWMA
jgi:hypothetical protein